MTGQVFYRKWRPQRFADVVGQEYVTQTLLNALATDRVAHAYLLCGPRGTGKTSTGRIMAKALNCLRNGKGEPCNSCAMCAAIAEGRALDLIEIDAASNRGIDDMRSLREKVNFAPNDARYKVYIIDEVHMLSTDAFNALLKTLEEPPPRTVFILATTDPQKVPPTVISRCQRFDFRRISLKDVANRLVRLCEDEGIQAAPEVLMAVARSAGGSLRDAENLFEQLVVGYGQTLEMAQLRDFLGLGGERHVRDLTAAALAGDVPGGLRVIGDASSEGLDLRQFHRQLMEYLRAVLLVKSGVEEGAEEYRDFLPEIRAAAGRAGLEQVLRAVKLFGQVDLRANSYNTLPFELALVECASAPAAKASAQGPDAASDAGLRRLPQPAPSLPRPTPPAPAPRVPPAPPAPRGPQPPAPGTAQPAPRNGTGAQDAVARLKEQWNAVIEASKSPGQKVKMDALLRSAEPVSVDAETVVLGFAYEKFVDMMKQEMENPASKRALEEALAGVLGGRRGVRYVLQPRQKKAGGHLLKAAMEMGATVVEGSGDKSPAERSRGSQE